jgi:hypothetical protein
MNADDLRSHYATLSDDEVLRLAMDRSSLTDIGQAVLDEELSRRGLQSEHVARFTEEFAFRPPSESDAPEPARPRRPIGILMIVALLVLFGVATISGIGLVYLRYRLWVARGLALPVMRVVVALLLAWGLFKLHNWARLFVEAACLLEIGDGIYTIMLVATDPRWKTGTVREFAPYFGVGILIVIVIMAIIWDYLRRPAIKALFGHTSLPRIEPITSSERDPDEISAR